MTAKSLQLTPVQRQTIYRVIVQEPVVKVEPPTGEYRVGMRMPPRARLYTVRRSVVAEVLVVRTYK